MSNPLKAMSRPMKNGKIDDGRRKKIIGAILSDVQLVKSNGYTLVFDPTQSSDVRHWDRRIVCAKKGVGGIRYFGAASEDELQAAAIIS